MRNPRTERGFTLIEAIVVVAIMGLMMAYMFPSIMNSLETRNLDNSAREIQTTLQQARYRAVNDKIEYRVRFAQDHGLWRIFLESQDTAGSWSDASGFLAKSIDPRFVVALNLPTSQAVEFSPVGIVEGYDSTHNSLTLQSLKLKGKGQPDLRILTVLGGGSIRYVSAASG
jgi:prepilin-type N-terminal cleavage/methylation domain-containing protein